MPVTSDAVRERVTLERTHRAWSVRTAASRGGISNETWGRYEKGGKLTPDMRAAIAKAFDWSADWPENPPTLTAPPNGNNDSLNEVVRLQRETLTLIRLVAGFMEPALVNDLPGEDDDAATQERQIRALHAEVRRLRAEAARLRAKAAKAQPPSPRRKSGTDKD